jgi:hypothetical protein
MTDKLLTQVQADTFFISMVKPYATGVIEACGGYINQNQLDALTSFTYNCGVGAFRQSTLLQNVLHGKVTEADFTLYDHVGKQVSVGLLNRRKAEYQLFIKPIAVVIPPIIKTMIKFVKFFDSATHTVKTYFTAEKVLDSGEATFDFATGEEAQAHSTAEAFVFFDNVAIGAGLGSEATTQ